MSRSASRHDVTGTETMPVTATWPSISRFDDRGPGVPPSSFPPGVVEGEESVDGVENRQLRRIAIVGSLLLHASLLLVLAAWLLPRPSADGGVVIETTMGAEDGANEALDMNAAESLDAAQSDRLFAVTAASIATIDSAEKLPAGLLAGINEDNGGSSGDGNGSVGFFGVKVEGQSFVFVVDYSGSMQGYRFSRARDELIRTLGDLTPQQKFFVIFYNHRAQPMYASGKRMRLMPASPSTLRRTRRWINKQHAHGRTYPDIALKMALEMKPDVIFFLSDGDFPRTARTVAREANTHGTIIHTIAFEYDGGQVLLKGIAEDNHGRYRFVN
jgi:hypothetical protein